MHFGYFMLQVTLSTVVCSTTGLNTTDISSKFMDQDDDVTTNMMSAQVNERNKTTKTQTLTDRPTLPTTDWPTLPTTDETILTMKVETTTKEQAQEFQTSSTPTSTSTNVPGVFWHQRRILRIFFVALPATIILLGSIILILTRSFLTKSCKSQESKDLIEEQTANLASEAGIKGHDSDVKESELPDDKNNVPASLEKITGDESKSDEHETQIKPDDGDLGKTNGSDMPSDTKQTEDEPIKTDMKLDVLSTFFGVDDKEMKPPETATATAKENSPKDVKQTVTETDQKHPSETKPTEFTKNIINVAAENVESNLQVNEREGNACKPQSASNTNQSPDPTKLAESDDKTKHLENDPTVSFPKEPVVTNIKDTSGFQIDTKENVSQGDLKSPPHQSGPTLESRQELLIAIAELNAEVELLPSFPQAENLASDTVESNVAEKVVPAENLMSDTPESNVTEKVAPPATPELVDPPGSTDLENLGLPEPPDSIDLNLNPQFAESLDLKDEETLKLPEPPPESDDSEDEEDSDN